MKFTRFIFTLTTLLAFVCPPAFAGIKASGSAEIFNNNLSAAKDQAKRNAMRDAVEKGVGTLIDANTKVANWQVIRDEIYTSATGYVSKYETLKEGQEGSRWVIEIDAEVATANLKDKLKSLRILHKKMGNKRLMVIYRPEDPKALDPDHNAVIAGLAEIQTQLNNAGFRVFDQKSVDRIAGTRRVQANRNMESWMQIAAEQQADTLAEFELSTNVGNRGGAMIQSARIALKLRVYDVSTGRLIANQVANQKSLTNARPGSFDWRNALASAAQKAANQATNEGIVNITKHYESVGDLGNAFLIRLTGFSEDDEDTVLQALENLDGYQSLSEIKNDTEMIEIEYFSQLKKSQLRRKIRFEAKNQGVRLKSQSVSGNRLEFVKQY